MDVISIDLSLEFHVAMHVSNECSADAYMCNSTVPVLLCDTNTDTSMQRAMRTCYKGDREALTKANTYMTRTNHDRAMMVAFRMHN